MTWKLALTVRRGRLGKVLHDSNSLGRYPTHKRFGAAFGFVLPVKGGFAQVMPGVRTCLVLGT